MRSTSCSVRLQPDRGAGVRPKAARRRTVLVVETGLAAQRVEQPSREFRAFSGLLVLEVDVDVTALGGPLPDHARPPLDVGWRVSLVAKAEVAVVGGDLDGGRELLAVGDAERQIARAQAPVD